MSDGASIEERKNGPLVVKGVTRMAGPDGTALESKPVMALCRCGRSATKPFCDGSHSDAGFAANGIEYGRPEDGRWYDSAWLVCESCRHCYPVHDGVPVLLSYATEISRTARRQAPELVREFFETNAITLPAGRAAGGFDVEATLLHCQRHSFAQDQRIVNEQNAAGTHRRRVVDRIAAGGRLIHFIASFAWVDRANDRPVGPVCVHREG